MQQNTTAASRRLTAGFLPGPRLREVRTALLGWGLYMTALTVYCLAHQKFVLAVTPDLENSVMWSVREWGIWVLLTPVAFKILRRHWPAPDRRVPVFVQMGAGILLVSLTFRVGLDVVTGYRDALASLVIFFPRHLAALAAVALIWYLLLRGSPPTESHPPRRGERAAPRSLLVYGGGGERLIPVERIQYVSAAGNYVEIGCDGRTWLMRATMRRVEALLPPPAFLRVHRSHIVNVSEIDGVKSRRPGNGEVRLRCGKTLSVSRRYKQRLFQQCR